MSVGDRLLFIISAPRSGSTVLMRILNAAPGIHGQPELHLMPPLVHLGLWRTVDVAPFDALQAREAMQGLVSRLPGGEDDYVAACRAYADALYGGLLAAAPAGTRYLIDKTPANALVLPELRRLYPDAKVIVLTRHPGAVFVSYAESFFGGDFEEAARFNPILRRYVPAIAQLIRADSGPLLHVRYESLLADPEAVLAEISAFVGVEIPPEALEYGHASVPEGRGDPKAARLGRLQRSPPRWPLVLADPLKRAVVTRQLDAVTDAELALWSASMADFQGLEDGPPSQGRRLGLRRWALVRLRASVASPGWRGAALTGLLERVRDGVTVLLR